MSNGNYPPGMPSARTELVELHCQSCGHETTGVMLHELGGHFLTGDAEDGCSKCGGDWDDDRMDAVEAPEPDYDEYRERMMFDDPDH